MFNDNGRLNWTVLIVDDDIDNLTVAAQVLRFHGATIHAAEDGHEALEILSHIEPTLIILDLSMPKMDGWTMLGRLKDNPRTASIPVIAVTAHAMAGDRDRVLKAGFDAYISKPFDIMTFMEVIKKIVDQLALP